VFLEVVAVLLVRRGLDAAVAGADLLLEAREVEFVPCSEGFLATLETFRTQRGARLSFADAAVVTVARARADGRIATFDRGFQRLSGVSVVPEPLAAP
jgi:predicted nucleic acid-binding protein